MKSLALFLATILCCSTTIGQQTAPSAPATRPALFQTVDIFIDPHGSPLAAYQFDLTAGPATIVGIEGGDSPAFAAAPYYDPKAIQKNHAIIAAFSLDANLPKTKSRVARVHLYNDTGSTIDYSAKLTVAANSTATRIDAAISIENGGSK